VIYERTHYIHLALNPSLDRVMNKKPHFSYQRPFQNPGKGIPNPNHAPPPSQGIFVTRSQVPS